MKHTFFLIGLLAFSGVSVNSQAQGLIENPQPNSPQSGVTVVSGWHCNANVVEIQIDGGRLIPVAYGTERRDTIPVCGDADNGFGFLINYNALGDGAHTVSAFADGVEFGSVDFTVSTLGEEFARGLEKEVIVPAFPDQNVDVILRWQEASQNFHIAGVLPGGTLSIVGAWQVIDPNQPDFSEFQVAVFRADGSYAMAFEYSCNADGIDYRGMETGTYRYDVANKSLTITSVTTDDNAFCGFADSGQPYDFSGWQISREGDSLRVDDPDGISVLWPKL